MSCPACDPAKQVVVTGATCFMCGDVALPKSFDDAAAGGATPPAPAQKSSRGAKSAGARVKPRPQAPPKKQSSRRGTRRRRTASSFPRWMRAVLQPVFALGVGGCAIHITSLLIGGS